MHFPKPIAQYSDKALRCIWSPTWTVQNNIDGDRITTNRIYKIGKTVNIGKVYLIRQVGQTTIKKFCSVDKKRAAA